MSGGPLAAMGYQGTGIYLFLFGTIVSAFNVMNRFYLKTFFGVIKPRMFCTCLNVAPMYSIFTTCKVNIYRSKYSRWVDVSWRPWTWPTSGRRGHRSLRSATWRAPDNYPSPMPMPQPLSPVGPSSQLMWFYFFTPSTFWLKFEDRKARVRAKPEPRVYVLRIKAVVLFLDPIRLFLKFVCRKARVRCRPEPSPEKYSSPWFSDLLHRRKQYHTRRLK